MDNPSCPSCGHYNALLGETDDAGKESRVCRDCGCRTDVEGKLEPPEPSDPEDWAGEDDYDRQQARLERLWKTGQ